MTDFPYKIGDLLWVNHLGAIGKLIGFTKDNNSWQVQLQFRYTSLFNSWYDLDSTRKPTPIEFYIYG